MFTNPYLDKYEKPIAVGDLVWIDTFEIMLRHRTVTMMLGRIIIIDTENYNGNNLVIDVGSGLPKRYRRSDEIELAIDQEELFKIQETENDPIAMIGMLENLI